MRRPASSFCTWAISASSCFTVRRASRMYATIPATRAGKTLPRAWASPLKKKAEKVTSAAARERSRLIIREASGSASVYPGKCPPARQMLAVGLPAPLALLERRLRPRDRRAVAQVDVERARIGEAEGFRRGRRAERPRAQGPRRRGDGRQCVDRGNRLDLANAIVLHGSPLKTSHRTAFRRRWTLLGRPFPAPADTDPFLPMLPAWLASLKPHLGEARWEIELERVSTSAPMRQSAGARLRARRERG